MKRRIIALTALTALTLGGAAFAQDANNDAGGGRRGGRGGMRHDPMERQLESLNLTADQKAKVQPILDQAKPKMEEIHRDATQKTKALMEDTMAKIRPMLTTEQQTKLDEMKNNRRGDREGRRGRRGGDNSGGGSDDNG
jgi:Spy/CpxP family protein refolding chaperone